MADERAVKDALARLATGDDVAIERAATATGDLERAARFREQVGLDRLRSAIAREERRSGPYRERGSEPSRVERGRTALRAFEAFEAAAATAGAPALAPSERSADRDRADEQGRRVVSVGGHFRRGHGTAIRGDAQGRADDAGDPHR